MYSTRLKEKKTTNARASVARYAARSQRADATQNAITFAPAMYWRCRAPDSFSCTMNDTKLLGINVKGMRMKMPLMTRRNKPTSWSSWLLMGSGWLIVRIVGVGEEEEEEGPPDAMTSSSRNTTLYRSDKPSAMLCGYDALCRTVDARLPSSYSPERDSAKVRVRLWLSKSRSRTSSSGTSQPMPPSAAEQRISS